MGFGKRKQVAAVTKIANWMKRMDMEISKVLKYRARDGRVGG